MTALATAETIRELGRALGGSLDAVYALTSGAPMRAAAALAPLAIEWIAALAGDQRAPGYRDGFAAWLADPAAPLPASPTGELAAAHAHLVEILLDVTDRATRIDRYAFYTDTEIEWDRMRSERRGPPAPEPTADDHLLAELAAIVATRGAEPGAQLAALWARLLEVQADHDAWDSEFTPSPHSPWTVIAELAGHGESAVPFLVARLGDAAPAGELALDALEATGARAALALPALLANPYRPRVAAAVCAIDLRAAIAQGIHLLRATREAVLTTALARRSAAEAASLVSHLLRGDAEQQHFTLEHAGGAAAVGRGDLVALTESADPKVSSTATRELLHGGWAYPTTRMWEVLARPDRATSLLEVYTVAELERSEWLIPSLVARRDAQVLRELFRRRRHAGLRTPQLAHLTVVAHLEGGGAGGREASVAIQLAAELDTRAELAPLVDAAQARWLLTDGSVGRFRAALGSKRPWCGIDHADDRFACGEVVTATDSAFETYDLIQLAEPRNAHAAFQLAWISRAFGRPIEPRRIAWLRELGVRDEALLAELAAPVAALRHMDYREVRYTPASTDLQLHLAGARAAEAAGLLGAAANLAKWCVVVLRERAPSDPRIGELDAMRARCAGAVQAHLARVQAATR